jgi:hypothetical protein
MTSGAVPVGVANRRAFGGTYGRVARCVRRELEPKGVAYSRGAFASFGRRENNPEMRAI